MDLECPYCEEGLDVDYGDDIYDEDVNHQMSCSKCDKSFVFTTSVMYYHSAEKADCLNGADHDFNVTATFPKFLSRMRCTMCGEEREPTEKESLDLELGTEEEYFEGDERIKTKIKTYERSKSK